MGRLLPIRKPRASEIRRLVPLVEEPIDSIPQRRAQAVLLYSEGMSAVDIAHTLEVHVNTIYADLRTFHQYGVSGIHRQGQRGAPAQLSPAQIDHICHIADQPPSAVGLVYGRWSLTRLRTYLLRQRIVPQISRAHLGRLLKKGACRFAGSNAS